MNIKEQIRKEIDRRYEENRERARYDDYYRGMNDGLDHLETFLDSLPEQPVSDHHEIEVEFRGEKVTISREFYRDGEKNYSTSEQDDNAIWSILRAWCEKKGITPFELYPKQPEQPVEGLEEAAENHIREVIDAAGHPGWDWDTRDVRDAFIAGAGWMKSKYEK